jgi:hypothetical protein
MKRVSFSKIKFSEILFLFLVITLSAQAQNFPTEHDKFVKTFSGELGFTGEIRQEGKSMSREFTRFWDSDTLAIAEKNNFIELANLLSSKGAKSYPDLVLIADNLMQYKRRRLSRSHYEEYEAALKNFFNRVRRPNLKDVSEFLFSVNNLLSNDIVQKNPRTFWKTENTYYSFSFDKEFVIIFENVNLIGYQDKDSLKIYNTDGVYYPMQKLWVGKSGVVGWERVGYGLDSIQATLQNYKIDMRNITYTADSVTFTNSLFFKQPMLGRLIDKAGNLDNPSKSDYPKFTSYKQHFILKNIVPGVDYEGGFSIHGRSFIGSGTKEEPAKMFIRKNDTVYLNAYSRAFYIDPEMIVSNPCAIMLRLGQDSIYHPYLTFRFHNKRNFLELIRSKDDMSQVHYTNSYHKVKMDFSWLKWNIDKFKIEFTTIKTPGVSNEALFESNDYYRLERYRNIQKHDQQHPLKVITGFVSSWAGNPEFYLDDLSRYMGYSPNQVVQMVLNLAYMGFLSYDSETKFIRVYPEAWTFLEAHRGVRDSDVIQFYSKTESETPNAELSLLNFDLKINGIREVHLSDSQSVKVYPIDQKITLKKDRTFIFNGTVQAGQFYYYGNNFKFDYNRFMLDLSQCDSMKMVAETEILDANGQKTLAIVRNKLEQINGEFYIDEPNNKSGKDRNPEYPKFISKEKTYVYYDRSDVYNKAYRRDRFYFEVDPFVMDSIKGFARENLKFKGTLYSGGIFPPIKETLVLRYSDFSLGFNMRTGPLGLPLYDGRATYFNEIDLSNKGLRGVGIIDYLTSKVYADYLIFFLDHMEGHSEKMQIAKQKAPVEFPSVEGKSNTLRWDVKEDQFLIKKDTVDFKMFDNKATLDGDIVISSNGLKGKGLIVIEKATLRSKDFNFKQEEILSDTADFQLYTLNILNTEFESDNVQAHVSFTERKGEFKTNGKSTIWRFPKNKYITEMNQLTWFMDNEELEISADMDVLEKANKVDASVSPNQWEELFMEGPKFTSIHPRQDSLSFVAPRAKYNYKDHIITAEGVKFIRVADATIYTEDGIVVIEPDAIMRPIYNAKIIANNTTRYHTIYNSVVNIYGKRNYTAYGDIDYIDITKQPQTIHLTKIAVGNTGQTYGIGAVTEPDNFMLSPYFKYQGEIKLYANNKNFEFNGAAKTIDDCDTTGANWIKFKSFIDPEDIYIPVDQIPYNINNTRLIAGLVLSASNQIYPSFLGRKRTPNDQEIFSVSGFLHYDKDEGKFMIASKDKLAEPSLPGNYIHIHKNICNVYGQGKFNFSNDFGLFVPNIIGEFLYYPDTDTTEFNVSMILDAHFNSSAQKLMAEKINSVKGLTGINMRDEIYQYALTEYLGTKRADEWFSNLSLGNFNKFPKELSEKMIFTDLNFKWYSRLKSYVHYGPIGIVNLGKEQVNKYVFGFIRIEKSRRGDTFEMLLEPNSTSWYYFKYSAGTFSAVSSDENFNKIIYDAKPSQREIKKDGKFYQYGLGGSNYMKRFKKEMYEFFKIESQVEDE